jgi:type I restriction enzyme M protein
MLDSDTKRRIDTARDILVGKVPDPKSQVEQITLALIYKFMDDMDAQSEELGGTRKFFANEFARYGWAKLMAPGVSGHELVGLYGEGIAKMPENPGIPTLFRDIFKNAYLPYRDPETLKSFLKVIDEFEYDHSERLGDAFEYLLSVLGSQGDAGQFRTPRHIIDFVVKIVDPKKNETILDPACGTAGFLISAWKHISKANAKDGHSGLTPDERKKLAAGITGYDIDPMMAKLSRSNMYLHGFADPHIYEYDTLTSQEKWKENADVILANPPFMSPKGGIKPHNRFSVQSKRSEVLFVDYMAEHLTPNGRAGIIVPEGVIFQSQSAYVDLRRMLVNDFLVAVISLPAGVFNPYSGVKTSILILDRSLAKQSDTVGFFKVENDGFGLGAQRREVKGEQLTRVAAEIGEYLGRLRARHSVEDVVPTLGLIVPKAKIAENGDYNLSGERYQAAFAENSRFPMVPLGEVAELIRGITFGKADQLQEATEDSLLVATTKAAQEIGVVAEDLYHIPRSLLKDDSKLLRAGDILISTANSLHLLGRTTHVRAVDRPMSFGAFMSVVRPSGKILDGYLLRCLRTEYAADFYLRNANTTTNISNLNLSTLAGFKIPLPPLEVQREIVAEIEGYQKVIDGARAVLDHYRPHIPTRPEWPMVALGQIISDLESGVSVNSENRPTVPGEVGILKTSCVTSGVFLPQEHKAVLPGEVALVKCKPKRNSIIISRMNTEALVGANAYVDRDFDNLYLPDRLWQTVIKRTDVETRYVQYVLASDECRARISAVCGGTSGSMKNIAKSQFLGISIPLPPIETQQQIVAEIEAEQRIVAANRELVARFEKKIEAAIARVWGEATPVAASTSAANEEA